MKNNKFFFTLIISTLLFCCTCYPLRHSSAASGGAATGGAATVTADSVEVESSMEGFGFGVEFRTYPVSTKNIKASLWNDTKSKVFADEHYAIDRYTDSGWQSLKLDLLFISIGYILEPNERKDFTIYLPHDQYNFTPGKYRVEKKVSSGKEAFTLRAEFMLE